MKITGLKIFLLNPGNRVSFGTGWGKNTILVKIHTDEGIHGVGEAFGTGKAKTIEAALYEYERWLKDKDPTEVLRNWYAYYRGSRYPLGTATMAALSAVTLAPHQACGPVSLVTCAQIDACIPNFLIQECNVDLRTDFVRDLYRDLPVIEDGYLKLPEGPGLGIEFNEEAAEKYPSKPYDRPVIVQLDGGIASSRKVMEQRTLGRTGLKVSVMGMGTGGHDPLGKGVADQKPRCASFCTKPTHYFHLSSCRLAVELVFSQTTQGLNRTNFPHLHNNDLATEIKGVLKVLDGCILGGRGGWSGSLLSIRLSGLSGLVRHLPVARNERISLHNLPELCDSLGSDLQCRAGPHPCAAAGLDAGFDELHHAGPGLHVRIRL